jgi:hypothetical protein
MLGTGVRVGDALAVRPWWSIWTGASSRSTRPSCGQRVAASVSRNTPRLRQDGGYSQSRSSSRTSFGADWARTRSDPPASSSPARSDTSATPRTRPRTSGEPSIAPNSSGLPLIRSAGRWQPRPDEAGLSARQIADHLGHARPSVTQDVYMGGMSPRRRPQRCSRLVEFCDREVVRSPARRTRHARPLGKGSPAKGPSSRGNPPGSRTAAADGYAASGARAHLRASVMTGTTRWNQPDVTVPWTF